MADPTLAGQFRLQGLDSAVAKLRSFPAKLKKGALLKAVRKGANIVRDAARVNALSLDDPQTAENIAANVSVRLDAKESRLQGGIVLRVGVLGGARRYGNNTVNRRKNRVGKVFKTAGSSSNPGGDTYYWRYLEFGTSKMAATPFMRPALANNIEKATDAIVAELKTAVDKIAAGSAL